MPLYGIFNYNCDFLKTDRTHKNREYVVILNYTISS